MNSIDYTKNLNRQNEIYQKKLREQQDSYAENLASVKESSDNRIQSQKQNYDKDKLSIEKNHQDIVEGLRKNQNEELQTKSKRYEEVVEKNKNEAHDLRQKTLKEWQTKFGDLQKSYKDSLDRNEVNNKNAKDELASNYKENIESVRKKADTDVRTFVANNEKARGDSTESYRQLLRDKDFSHQEEKNQLLQDRLRHDNKFKKSVSEEIQAMRDKQVKEFNEGRDQSQERFVKLSSDVNANQQKFQNESIDNLQKNNQIENRKSNDLFQKRYAELDKRYEKNLRDKDNKARAEKITKGDLDKKILSEQRANERDEYNRKVQELFRERANLTTSYENKIKTQDESNQDSYQKLKIDNADKIARHELQVTEENRQKDLHTKIREENAAHNHRIELEYSEDRANDRLNTQQKSNDTQIRNLKEDFNKGMELAQLKSKKDFEKNREETVKEKAILQKRLHESNSKNNTYLKKVYSDKMTRMQLGYEKRIAELEAQNKMILKNSNDTVMDVTERSQKEVERQRLIAEQTAKEIVKEERQAAQEQENNLRRTITNLQTDFSKKLNEQGSEGARRLKKTVKTYEMQIAEQDRKYRGIIDQNAKLYEREVARIVAANNSEREALISQYENRIKELQKIQQDKIQELKEFDRVSNNA